MFVSDDKIILYGTGHRPDKLGGYSLKSLYALTGCIQDELRRIQPSEVIAGGALGFDQALALAAIQCNIPLTLAIPFRGFYRQWPSASQTFHRKIMRSADKVVYVTHGRLTDKYEIIKALQVRNEWMADHGNSCLTMWDGTPGGTANCISYSRKIGRPIHNMWPDFGEWIRSLKNA